MGAEIRSAAQAGKEVTLHERAINAHGWSGYGYIVTDPETGAGGYIIEGRGNSGVIWAFAAELASILLIYFFGPFAILGLGWVAIAFLAGGISTIKDMALSKKDALNAIADAIGLFTSIAGLMNLGPTPAITISIVGLFFN